MLLVAGLVLAGATWAFVFVLPREGLWSRTWVAAAVLSAFSVAALAATDRLDDSVGPLSPLQVGAGLLAGGAWLVATHVGHDVLARLVPGFVDQVADLYRIRDDAPPRSHAPVWSMAGAVAAMSVAEELFFRGFVQDRVGLVAGVAAYTAVQLVERKWALGLAALLGGTVWGLVFWATGGLLAPVVAHVLWTGVLTFAWPLRSPAPRPLEVP